MNRIIFLIALALAARGCAGEIGLRFRFGLNDKEATDWSGTVAVEPGKVVLISGWRFAQQDKVDGTQGWSCRTRPQAPAQRRGNNPQTPQRPPNVQARLPITDNGVLISLADATEDSLVTMKTAQGEFSFKVADVPLGKIVEQLGGAVEVERTAAAIPLTSDPKTDDDYPAAASAWDGRLWVTWQSFTPGIERVERAKNYQKEPESLEFLAKAPGGDQLWLSSVPLAPKGSVDELFSGWKGTGNPIAITPAGRDIYRSAVAVAGDGRVWVIWSENSGYAAFPKNGAPNFDIWARAFDPKTKQLSEPMRLSDSPESDVWPVATTDAGGNVWVAWQGAREGKFRIFARFQGGFRGEDGKPTLWSEPFEVSKQSGNCWAPAIAARRGKVGEPGAGYPVAIAWDTYAKGDYDVWVAVLRSSSSARGDVARLFDSPRPVASSADYEARPAIAYDHGGSLWIAWEQSGPTWGKDFGALDKQGIPLYRDRQIGLAVLEDGKWMQPVADFRKALPAAAPRRRQLNQRVPPIEPGAEPRRAAQEAEIGRNFPHNNLARIVCDRDGRIWLFARARQNDFRTPLGSLWFDWAAYLDGDKWVGPTLVPHSDNLLYNTPAVVAAHDGGLSIIHSSDHRQDHHLLRRGPGGNIALEAERDPFDNDLYVSRVQGPSGDVKPAKLEPAKAQQGDEQSAATKTEREEIARIRAYRATVNDKKLQILRGEFHRHTEISGDGGNDGPLEDMWRYALDVAAMDWLGCGDHDNGAGREYPWWLTQKTTDAFYLPARFNSLYTYERSVRYPEGHRNVIFTQRGIRTLPRLPKMADNSEGHAPDTQMLYKYLRLFDGVCASHTSATDMGTDWRDWDLEREPMVEIYQGARQNYERPGAPRSPVEKDAIGGWRPKGFVNLALLKGYKFAFECSSDHGSTHISYANVYAEAPTREAILAAMKLRHVYGATDNIIADFRCVSKAEDGKEHMMGDEFTATESPKLRIHLEGTAPFKRVVFLKNDVEIFVAEPMKAVCDLERTDDKPEAGKTSYYYVRGEQENGELVWASPMWIGFRAAK